ncbi:uncharacterized protein LOC131685864 [Topomyia yanbarensis]|uniref:uncharacterized protein LOC131685864 n=1 Tax=Topomyia yanbarensis TaxID=2498891 RepID=UPI00273AC159|nr:uncharacterized protein LOC131685864 [Topomyia yanbarensis]
MRRQVIVLLISACVALASAGICQDIIKKHTVDRPFFKVVESQGIEIYYPKKGDQEMFGIKIYKNKDIRKKNLACDLCVNTTLVEDGCFKITSTALTVEVRDILKYVTLAKFTGSSNVTVAPSKKAEFIDFVIPTECVCRDPPGGYCAKASNKIIDYRPLFKLHEQTRIAVYLPKASAIGLTVGLKAIRNVNFYRGIEQNLDLNIQSFTERNGCFVYESLLLAPNFALGDYLNYIVIRKKPNGKKIRTEPRKAYLMDYFIPSSCSCQPDRFNLIKPPQSSRN